MQPTDDVTITLKGSHLDMIAQALQAYVTRVQSEAQACFDSIRAQVAPPAAAADASEMTTASEDHSND